MKLPRVTDHALIRYLERVKGFDIKAIRQHIAELCAGGASVRAMSVKAEGVSFELDRAGRSVLTVTPNTGSPSKTKKLKAMGVG